MQDMDSFLISVFESEVKQQALNGYMAYQLLLQEIECLNYQGRKRSVNPLWYHIHSLLNCAANVSKVIWGSKQSKHMEERSYVKSKLSIDDNFYIANREMRNNFEHLDERLIIWSEKNPQKIFFDRAVGPINGISNISPDIYLRHFDPETMDLYFHGSSYNLKKVAEELKFITKQ